VATATSTPLHKRSSIIRTRSPLALWHLLSLDAPTVAALWTWFIARANHIHLPISAILAMAVAVWMLYAADRLMDTRLMDTRLMDARLLNAVNKDDLEARHYFHHRHRTAFLAGILVASLALAVLLPRLEPAALHLYLILGGLLAGYFILIHATPQAAPTKAAPRLPKEIAVGIFFAAAIFIPTVARRPDLRAPLLPAAFLFAALCSLNCLFIYAWEHPRPDPSHPAHATTRFALSHLPFLTISILLVAAALVFLALAKTHQAPWPIPTACALSSTLLLLLHHRRRSIAPITLRAAADLALITPLILLPFLHL
jgi:hypothetical protein